LAKKGKIKEKKVDLTSTDNAHIWADEWLKAIKKNPTIPYSRDTMIGWFANSIMVGYDLGMKQKCKK